MRTPLSFLFLLITTLANAQNAAPSWLESTLYGNGKINVVVDVDDVIINVISIWLWRMDRRISSLEKEKGA